METNLITRDGRVARIGTVVRVLSERGTTLRIGAIERISVLGMAKVHGWPGWVGSDSCQVVR